MIDVDHQYVSTVGFCLCHGKWCFEGHGLLQGSYVIASMPPVSCAPDRSCSSMSVVDTPYFTKLRPNGMRTVSHSSGEGLVNKFSVWTMKKLLTKSAVGRSRTRTCQDIGRFRLGGSGWTH